MGSGRTQGQGVAMLDRIHIEHGNINLLLEILLQKARLVEDGEN